MDIRDAVNFEYYKRMDTAEMRKNFLIQDLFKKDSLNLTYSYYDRMIVGGISPTKPIKLTMPREIIGGDYLLERREAGIINIGAKAMSPSTARPIHWTNATPSTSDAVQRKWSSRAQMPKPRPSFISIPRRLMRLIPLPRYPSRTPPRKIWERNRKTTSAQSTSSYTRTA